MPMVTTFFKGLYDLGTSQEKDQDQTADVRENLKLLIFFPIAKIQIFLQSSCV